MKGLWNFVQYNNAVPITLFIIFGVTGAAFAASPQVRDATAAAVLSQQQQVLAGDNTYLLGLDVPAFDFELQVTNVTEDDTAYYVDYQYNMVDPLDYVWRLYVASTSITVAKTEVQGKDLGLFISKQLGEVVAAKRAYLLAAQVSERKAGESQKIVSTTYSGLIGRFLDPEQETFEGYTPVINPVLPEEPNKGPSGCTADCDGTPKNGGPAVVGEVLGASTVKNSADGSRASTALISLQIMGRNPSLVPVGAMYVDLGAVLVDEKNSGVSYDTYLDGKQTYSPEIDTSKEATYAVEYRATDKNGTQISVTRTIKVLTYADYQTAIQNQVDAPPPPEPTPEPPQESLDQLPTGQAEPTPVEATSTPPTSEPEPAPAEATSTPPTPEPTPEPAPVEATSTPPVATSTPPVPEPVPEPTPEPVPAPTPDPVPVEATSTPATPDQTASTTPAQ